MKQLLIIISLLTISLSAAAQDQIIKPDSLWDSANTAYINGDYAQAIELYNAIEEQGLSSDVFYFNLGNAHYKNSDIARAILYYQKALLISPNAADILYNLQVAQSQTKDQIEEIPEFFLYKWSRSMGRTMSGMGWSVLSLAALVIFLASLLIFLLSKVVRWRKNAFAVGLFAAIIFWVATLYALDSRRELLEHNQGVIMSKSISIKSSPDRSATDLFMLHDGTTVKILREMDAWYEIAIADGKTGWIEKKRVERI